MQQASVSGTQTMAAQERDAYAAQEYQDLLKGLAAAVELSPSAQGVGQRGYQVFRDCLSHGVLDRSAGDNLVLAPAYVVEPAQITQMVDVLAQAIKRLA